MSDRQIRVRTRSASSQAGEPRVIRREWDPARAAVVICDMWDAIHCISAGRRVRELALRIDEVVRRLRARGTLIVHAPAGCMSFYDGTPARRRAQDAPRVPSPVPIDWNDLDLSREAELPESLADSCQCSCDTAEPCTEGGPPHPWTRQTDLIGISDDDAVTDDGAELLALLAQRGIEDVIVMGVHTNRCVLGRPYGIRQLVYWEKKPVLCRDLTDSFHRDPRGHAWGTERIIEHVERFWCPTVTSDQLIGGAPFRLGP